VAPLWEVILATMKLGAVIIPASTLLQPADLVDRVSRGQVRHVITDTAGAPKFAAVPGDWTRIVVGGDAGGWHSYSAAFGVPAASFIPAGATRAADPLLLYFTSGTTALPKLVVHTQVSYPVGHLSTMYWVGIQPGDVHLNLSSPGWAKHAWSNVYAPWNAGATVLVLNYQRFSASSLLAAFGTCGVNTFWAPRTCRRCGSAWPRASR
jgi:acetyl-CoA synthetase